MIITFIDHPKLNNNPSARIMATQNWVTPGTYNNNSIGVYYESTNKRWAVYNQNLVAMPVGAKFNILISDKIFMVDATAPSNNWYIFDNPLTNGQSNALVFVTQYWTNVYNNEEIGVWYTNGKWSVYNQSRKPMPKSAKFFVGVAATTCDPFK